MEAVARLKNCPMSARKMRIVVDNIRGKSIDEALNILRFTKNEAADWLYKVLLSAVANWEYKLDGAESADEYDLYIKRAMVDEGTFLKRFRPAPQGRGVRIKKRTNHVTLVVENKVPLDFELAGETEPEMSVEVENVDEQTAEKE